MQNQAKIYFLYPLYILVAILLFLVGLGLLKTGITTRAFHGELLENSLTSTGTIIILIAIATITFALRYFLYKPPLRKKNY